MFRHDRLTLQLRMRRAWSRQCQRLHRMMPAWLLVVWQWVLLWRRSSSQPGDVTANSASHHNVGVLSPLVFCDAKSSIVEGKLVWFFT